MKYQNMIEAQMLFGKLSLDMILSIAKDHNLKAIDNKFNFFEGEPKDAWKIRIEKVDRK